MDDNEIKRRLAGRAAEYMMFKDDEEELRDCLQSFFKMRT